MKKLLAITLALVMLLGILAGCSTNQTQQPAQTPQESAESGQQDNETVNQTEELEQATLKWYYPGQEMEGTADVIEAFNEKLSEVLPNTTVEFVFLDNFDAYGEQWPLLLAGEEQMDIAWSGWTTNIEQDVLDGNVLPLDDLIAQYAPNLAKEMNTWVLDWNALSKDGVHYAIPCVQPQGCSSTVLKIDPMIVDCFDLDKLTEELHSSRKTTPAVWDIIEEGIQKAFDTGILTVGDAGCVIYPLTQMGVRGYARYSGTVTNGGYLEWYYLDPDSDSHDVMNVFEIPEVQYGMERTKLWVEKGWITQAQLAGQEQEGAVQLINFGRAYGGTWEDCDERGIKKVTTGNDGREKIEIECDTLEQSFQQVANFGYSTQTVIPFTSKHPERAMMLLNILHDEPGTVGNDLINMLCYGFEDGSPEAEKYGWSSYQVKEVDGQPQIDTAYLNGASPKHTMFNWAICTTYKTMADGGSLTTASAKEYATNFWKNVYPNMPTSPISGMCPTSEEFKNELDSVQMVFSEYEMRLNFGEYELVDEYIEKANAAGLQTIKDNLKAQTEAFISG